MNDDAASLDRLNDIALPAAVPWWPLAPGWYALAALLALAGAWLAWRGWQRWRAGAYRRAALRELAVADSATTIAELLRRTALARVPRERLAGLSGAPWADWLQARCAQAMPAAVRDTLACGIYGAAIAGSDLRALRDYAAGWIATHRLLPSDAPAAD